MLLQCSLSVIETRADWIGGESHLILCVYLHRVLYTGVFIGIVRLLNISSVPGNGGRDLMN